MRGDPARAARLLGAAVGLRAGAGAAPDAAERAAHDQAPAARAALGDAATATASAVGEAMTLEQAVAYALENSTLHRILSRGRDRRGRAARGARVVAGAELAVCVGGL